MGDQTQRGAVTRDGLQYYVLPDDPVAALNILRRAAGLAPLPSKDTPVEE